MQFQVPQFIESEDKIIGPLSLRQFAYFGVGGLLSALLYFTLATWIWAIGTLIILAIAIALAFVKIEGRPFMSVVLSAFHFYWKPQTYVWQPEYKKAALPKKTAKEEESSGLSEILSDSVKKMKSPLYQPKPHEVRSPMIHMEPKEKPTAHAAEPEHPVVQKVSPARQEPAAVKSETRVQAQAAAVKEKPKPESKPEPISRESVQAGSALHRAWEAIQTGAPFAEKSSDKQFFDRKMAERYQIFKQISGDRQAAKRVDYR